MSRGRVQWVVLNVVVPLIAGCIGTAIGIWLARVTL